MGNFGFMATPAWDNSGWHVRLPHQMREWNIAGWRGQGIPQAEAIAALEQFIAEAQQALAALREGRSYGEQEAS